MLTEQGDKNSNLNHELFGWNAAEEAKRHWNAWMEWLAKEIPLRRAAMREKTPKERAEIRHYGRTLKSRREALGFSCESIADVSRLSRFELRLIEDGLPPVEGVPEHTTQRLELVFSAHERVKREHPQTDHQ